MEMADLVVFARAPIGGLFLESRPSAVIKRVITVAISAIKGHAIRPLPHIGKEGEKAPALARVPSLTNTDAPPAIVRVRSVARVAATPKHRDPTSVRWGCRHAMGDDSADVRLSRSGGANLSLRFLRMWDTLPIVVVASDIGSRHAAASGCQSPTAAHARQGLNGLAFVVAFYEALALLISQIRTPWSALAAAAGARWRFQSVSPQEIRRFISEKMFRGNIFSATAFAHHGRSVTQV